MPWSPSIWTYTLYQFEGESCAQTIFYSKNTGVTWKPQHKNVLTKKPRNDDRKLRNCYGHQLWFNYLPNTLINHYSLRIRGQDMSPMLNWLKTLDLLIQVTKECYNNVCKLTLENNPPGTICGKHCLVLTSFFSQWRKLFKLLWLLLLFSLVLALTLPKFILIFLSPGGDT